MQAQKLFPLPLRPLRGRNLYRRGGKRALDFSAAALGLLALAPVLAALAALVRLRLARTHLWASGSSHFTI